MNLQELESNVDNLYSFDINGDWKIVVEQVAPSKYEGIAFIHTHYNPPYVVTGADPEEIRGRLLFHTTNHDRESP